jgi:hypothetical protein
MLSIKDCLPLYPNLPQPVISELRDLDINVIHPTGRGTRAGKYFQRPIPPLISDRYGPHIHQLAPFRCRNLVEISSNSESLPIPVVIHDRDQQLQQKATSRISTKRNVILIKTERPEVPVNNTLSLGLINARSVKNKVLEIVDHIVDERLDIVAITESWMGPEGHDLITEGNLCPPGYKLILSSRTHGRGGGVALLVKSSIKHISKSALTKPVSFEYVECVLKTRGCAINLVVIYRPPPSQKNKFTVQQFLDEFAVFLEERVLSAQKLCLVGDFNFHVDDARNKDAIDFGALLESFGLKQHVTGSTHQKGHTLDLVITRSTDALVQDIGTKDTALSDHFWINCSLVGAASTSVQKDITFRKIKSISVEQFQSDFHASGLLEIDPQDSVETAVSMYNSTLSDLLDKHAPLKKKTVTLHPNAPWYTEEIDIAKKEKRKAEAMWRETKLTVHRDIFVQKKVKVNQLLVSAKRDFYSERVKECPDQKSLFKVANTLLNKSSSTSLPDHTCSQDLANRFNDFFTQKIKNIRQRLDTTQSKKALLCSNISMPSPPLLDQLEPTSPEEVKKIVMSSKTTSCRLDPMPTSFLKLMLNVLLPLLTQIVNMSFEQGVMPYNLKEAFVIPLLKKTGLDPEILKNFRPVSNLPFLSKLIERVSAKRLLDHMDCHQLHELYQSAYKKFHSTETALLRVHSDIVQALDGKKCVLLVLLDLSAAFDTIDHSILLERLKSHIGLSGKAFAWFKSYIHGRKQSVLINDAVSRLWELIFGVPQGSVLGPLLFIIYTSPLGALLRNLGIHYHLYADDTQLYLTFDLDKAPNMVQKIEEAVVLIKKWMAQNFLCLNDDKTEVLVIASRTSLSKLNIPFVSIGDENIVPSSCVKNIGFFFDKSMTLQRHVSELCRSAWFQLRQIGKIRQYLDKTSTERLIHAFITSKLDVNNSLLYGIPETLLQRLQRVQNAAARMLTQSPKQDHVSPILRELHWLPVSQRIVYKVLTIVFKALHGLAPLYIEELLHFKPVTERSMRSNNQRYLVVPRVRTVTYGDRNFRVFAPVLWNNLPIAIRNCEELNEFKKHLKTHLFSLSYN